MNVCICVGSACCLKGAREVIEILEKLIAIHNVRSRVTLSGSMCMGRCMDGVCCTVQGEAFSLTPEVTEEFFVKEILGRLNRA